MVQRQRLNEAIQDNVVPKDLVSEMITPSAKLEAIAHVRDTTG